MLLSEGLKGEEEGQEGGKPVVAAGQTQRGLTIITDTTNPAACRNLDLLLGLENRILYTAIDILEGECRLDQALIRDKRWKNLALLSMSRNRQRSVGRGLLGTSIFRGPAV